MSEVVDVIGVDIGGANIKYYSTCRQSLACSFAMWLHSESLDQKLIADLQGFGPGGTLAVTMTGELADCFSDRAVGVKHIVNAVMSAASRLQIGEVWFYGVDGVFYDSTQAIAMPDTVAAANWHALASLVARQFPIATTLVDIGSTTTDIIPLAGRRVATKAQTDHDRLVEGSLVYVGCRRTPVCSLVNRLQFRGVACEVMNEMFATMDDARLLLGRTQQDCDDTNTADTQPRTEENAAIRLARMIGLDRRTLTIDDAVDLAVQVVQAAEARIHAAFRRLHRDGPVVIAGHGSDLLILESSQVLISLADHWGESISRVAPSYAVASLYQHLIGSPDVDDGGTKDGSIDGGSIDGEAVSCGA